MALPDDFDPFVTTPQDMFALYREAHAVGCPVMHSTAHGGYQMVMSHAAVKDAAADWETFSSANGVTLPRFPVRNAAIEHDPPDHTYWRGVFDQILNPAAVRRAEDAVREDAARIIDSFAPLGQADLVRELSKVIPGNTICRLLGITDPDRVRRGCAAGVGLAEGIFDPARAGDAFGAFVAFIGEEIAARRAHPREDFLTRVATEEIDGHRLSDEEIHGLCTGFFIAGHETTTATMSLLFHTIATDAALRDRLIATPKLIGRAAEEAMRIESPLHGFFRTATKDTEIAGVPVTAGSEVWLNYAAANRDPLVFEDPEIFDADRRRNPHVAFGYGIHTCSGAPLARLEIRVVAEELLNRLPDLASTGAPVQHRRGGFNIVSITAVPVLFTARTDLSSAPQSSQSSQSSQSQQGALSTP